MICEVCKVRGPTQHVEFHQNIGLLVARLTKSVRGELCAACIDHYFWEFTLVTVLLGFWGVVSLFVAPLLIVSNIACYVGTRSGERGRALRGRSVPGPTAPGAALTVEARARLAPFERELCERLGAGEPSDQAVGSVARKARVSAAQAELFLAQAELLVRSQPLDADDIGPPSSKPAMGT
jgi:hypothetical protein